MFFGHRERVRQYPEQGRYNGGGSSSIPGGGAVTGSACFRHRSARPRHNRVHPNTARFPLSPKRFPGMLVLAAWLLSAGVAAQPDARVLLDEFARGLDSLTADFTQITIDGRDEVVEESTGRLYFRAPDLIRWDYLEPFPQEIVADGEKLWHYDEALEQVNRELGTATALIILISGIHETSPVDDGVVLAGVLVAGLLHVLLDVAGDGTGVNVRVAGEEDEEVGGVGEPAEVEDEASEALVAHVAERGVELAGGFLGEFFEADVAGRGA